MIKKNKSFNNEMIMKKHIVFFSAFLGLFAFASCEKEVNTPEQESNTIRKSIPFEVVAKTPDTKTSVDAETWEMDWEDGDVLYAVTTDEEWGAAYVSSEETNIETIAEFTYSGSKFSTTDEISDGEHTFNFLYTANGTQKTYHRGKSTSFSLLSAQNEDAEAPTAALKMNDVLAGQVKATTPTTFVNVSMKHLFTLMKVTLKNKTEEELTVNKFEISAEDATLAGIFNVTFGETPSISLKQGRKSSIAVEITNGAIAADGELPVYFVMAPLDNYSGDITFTVSDIKGNTYTKTNSVSGVTFNPGEYNTASYTLKNSDPIESVELDWTYPESGSATSAGINAIAGVTTSGLGTDYAESNSPYCIKFDTNDDFIQVRTDKAIGVVSVKYKMIGGSSSSSLEIYESIDGAEWKLVETLAISGAQNSTGELTTTSDFNSSSRLIKINFKKGSNIGIGGISITQLDNTVWNLSGISITNQPDKTSYYAGQVFDPTGMVVTATYVDADDASNTKTVNISNDELTYSPSLETSLALTDEKVTISYEGKTAEVDITVTEKPAGNYFNKVTSITNLTDGEYLIVYEGGELAFNGALKTLDAVSNTVKVDIIDNSIAVTDVLNEAIFTYDSSSKTLKSASGFYIGQTSDANGLESSATTSYENTISFDADGNANIVSGGAYLRYNSASNQTRFRYYKSSSYTGQKAVALYKK